MTTPPINWDFFDRDRPRHRHPRSGALDVMGGIADYSGRAGAGDADRGRDLGDGAGRTARRTS
jgi:hypothetical protein